MENPQEGRQIPMAGASKAQLKAFALHLGANATNFDTPEKLVEKIKAQGWEEASIMVFDAQPKKPTAAKSSGKSGSVGASAAAVITEPMVELTVHTQDGPGGKRHVFVGVNGKGLLIPRNKRCSIKLRYLGALENAIETKFEYDEDAKANLPRDMPSYPFQVHNVPSDAEKAAWHAYEASEEAKARRREKAPVPVYDAAGED